MLKNVTAALLRRHTMKLIPEAFKFNKKGVPQRSSDIFSPYEFDIMLIFCEREKQHLM